MSQITAAPPGWYSHLKWLAPQQLVLPYTMARTFYMVHTCAMAHPSPLVLTILMARSLVLVHSPYVAHPFVMARFSRSGSRGPLGTLISDGSPALTGTPRLGWLALLQWYTQA